jgi:hypothetical protein
MGRSEEGHEDDSTTRVNSPSAHGEPSTRCEPADRFRWQLQFLLFVSSQTADLLRIGCVISKRR